MHHQNTLLRFLFPATLFLVSASFSRSSSEKPLGTVSVTGGRIAGTWNEKTSVSAYRGIPFSAAPVGVLRWKAPQPVQPWSGVKNCFAFGPSPMQNKPMPFFMIGPEFTVPQQPVSEDCLYLNVWTGAKTAKEKRPVLVWIYGGGFFSGGAAAPGYSGEALAAKGIVFVSFNYRLGIFGFFSHPGLTAESPTHSSGNYGLMDQIAALQWVKKNIAAFGGDPNRVTIAGQSAGSASVNCLLASPLTKGLVSGAIGESGSLVVENPILNMRSRAESETMGLRLAAKLPDSTLSGMRAMSAADLQKNSGFYSPSVDGYVLTASVSEIYRADRQLHVPLLTGWNADEGFLLGLQKKEMFAREGAQYGKDSSTFRRLFPAETDAESLESQRALSVDKTIAIPQYRWALLQNNGDTAKTFIYNFTRKPPAEGDKKRFGAYHTAEIGYAFANLDSIDRRWEPADRLLARQMSSYWIRFVTTGNPNGPGLPVWRGFSDKYPESIVFGDSGAVSTALPGKEAIDFLFARYPGK